jgi:hypothetical protein
MVFADLPMIMLTARGEEADKLKDSTPASMTHHQRSRHGNHSAYRALQRRSTASKAPGESAIW